MANMSYCRFENTSRDLADCEDHILDIRLNDHEKNGRVNLIRSCFSVLEGLGCRIIGPNDMEFTAADAEKLLEEALGEIEPDEDDSEQYPHDEEDGISSDHLDLGKFESENS